MCYRRQILVGEESMKGEIYPVKSDFLLPQTYTFKLDLENIKCHQMWYLCLVIFPDGFQMNESASHVINQINSSLGVGNNELFS